MPPPWSAESEERYAFIVRQEQLERQLAFAEECQRNASNATKTLWANEVKKARFQLETHLHSRTHQTPLEQFAQ